MACDTSPATVIPIKPDDASKLILDVIPKYQSLMKSSVGVDSLYERAKKTIFELSKDLNMTEKERMDVVAGQITQMTVGITSHAMAQSVTWAKEDATIGYAVAKLKGEAILTQTKAQTEAYNKCKTENEAAYVCAQTTSVMAGSIRENGRIKTYELEDKCTPTSLHDEGLKYEQTLQVAGSTYQILADAYRKSGIVQIGVEAGTTKGIDGDYEGHTNAQTSVANRQVLSFEDSKRNHAVNASSQTIGQMIAAEAPLDDAIVRNYNKGMEYLLTDSTPIVPGGPVLLDPIDINWTVSGTDNVDDPSGSQGNLILQQVSEQVTVATVFQVGANTRNGDNIQLKINGGEYYSRHVITDADLQRGYVLMSFPTVKLTPAGGSIAIYSIDSYIQDVAGNYSTHDTYQLSIDYIPYG